MSQSTTYPPHPRTTVNRYKSRAAYDYSTIHSIVNSVSILHVSFVPSPDDPFPTILPMIGHMASFSDPTADPGTQPLDLYLHGHANSRLMKLPQSHPTGLPVCVAATLIDGYVLALTPFNHSCNYRSAVLHGYATVVEDEDEKIFAMQQMTDGLIPRRWENSRVPPTKTELQATAVLKVVVESASAKRRVGGPGDDRPDLKNEGVVGRVWTGVLPLWEHVGTPVPGEKNAVDVLPEYIESWIEAKNEEGERYALDAAEARKQ
ncbi:hypothetical protein AX16_000782 [Volvariella volvacea WC 439]|nr:hypothetical protein AX16_000782 [Volvariella volvacea WC 439]